MLFGWVVVRWMEAIVVAFAMDWHGGEWFEVSCEVSWGDMAAFVGGDGGLGMLAGRFDEGLSALTEEAEASIPFGSAVSRSRQTSGLEGVRRPSRSLGRETPPNERRRPHGRE